MSNIKQTARVLKALGNEYRLQIVSELTGGRKNVSAINRAVAVSQPALSQHLSKMRKAGIVKSERKQREIYYSLADSSVIDIIGLTQAIGKAI